MIRKIKLRESKIPPLKIGDKVQYYEEEIEWKQLYEVVGVLDTNVGEEFYLLDPISDHAKLVVKQELDNGGVNQRSIKLYNRIYALMSRYELSKLDYEKV
jgi:hypothetical protein